MFRRVLSLLAIGLVLASQAVAQQATSFTGQVKVERGTVLNFTILETLDSTTTRVGDDVPLCLARPLIVDGVVLLPAGRNGSWKSHESKACRSQRPKRYS